jgi:hypothetical protein
MLRQPSQRKFATFGRGIWPTCIAVKRKIGKFLPVRVVLTKAESKVGGELRNILGDVRIDVD